MGLIKHVLAAVLAAFLLFASVGCEVPEETNAKAKEGKGGAAAVVDDDEEDSDDEEVVSEPEEPETYKPSKDDFKALLKVTSRSCFGSAGCNIEYKVGLRWLGPRDATLDKTYDVYYKVLGGDMGVSTDTIRVTPKLRYGVVEGYDSTGNVADQLTVQVVRIGNANGF